MSSRSTTRAGCIMIFGWSSTAYSSPGPLPRGHRSIPATSALQSKWKTILSTMAISKAPYRRGNMGEARFSSGTAGIGYPKVQRRLEQALAKGDLKFTLEGDRLHGSWVLVRMKHDRMGGKRNNWLLIKHRDDHAVDTDGSTILAEDRSIASGRTMAAIAAGTGRAPKPFMLAGASTKADAVWDSRHGLAADKRRQETQAKSRSSAEVPDFIAPQLCESVERPPTGKDGRMRSSSMAIVFRCGCKTAQ